jgi:glucose/arabinose dehydrogenase
MAADVRAITLPSGFTEFPVASGLSSPTAMAFAPDGRIFICQQGGSLRVVENGALVSAPFLSLTVDSAGERGLLGIAFDPNFASNNFIYVYYTVPSPLHNRVSRFTAGTGANRNSVVPGSEMILLDISDATASPGASNHNGGALKFSLDGKLMIAIGERANTSNSQVLTNLLGKMLRMNPDGSIPTDNPFFGSATGSNRLIWALGLRNPFSFDVQPGTGRIFINDVGGGSWEEVNDGGSGVNFGWPNTEGPTTNPSFRSPLYAYSHSSGCAIVGAAFYNPPTPGFPPDYTGDYFFADLCSNWIRVLDASSGYTQATTFATETSSSPVDLETGPDGALYYLARGGGVLRRIAFTNATPPVITTHPASQTVPRLDPVTFSVTASGSPTLTYQWQRNSADIGGATSSSYTIPSVDTPDNGAQFRCRVTNGQGSVLSNQATLTVTTNARPTGSITAPAAGARYTAGDTISFSGTGTDAEDGTLAGSAFTWRVDFHHDTHLHPFMPSTSGMTSGNFTIPISGETSANVWYRIHLTLTDSGGLTRSMFRDVLPRVARVTLATSPSGLLVSIDGQAAQAAPVFFDGVAGVQRSIGVAPLQTRSGVRWELVSWSDGGAATHNVSTPAVNTTYTATFRQIAPTSTRGDMNGDGWPDLVWRNQSTGQDYLWLMQGVAQTGGGAFTPVADTNWRIVGLADFNGDRFHDLLWRHQTTGANHMWFLNGMTQVGGGPVTPVADANWKIVGAGDFNFDNRQDIVWRNQATGANYVWYMNGTASTGNVPLTTVADLSWRIVTVTDLNNDGRSDLVWRHQTTGANYAWFMNGTSQVGGGALPAVPDANWRLVGSGDFNRDGRTDLVWRNHSTGADFVWYMNGLVQTGGAALPSVADTAWAIVPSVF